MREPVELRRQRILAAVQARGAARVTDLAAELEVSVVTVRRDVEELAREGRLRRGHGVARSILPVPDARPEPVTASGDGDTVVLVVPARHSYLYETLHGARPVLEEAGVRIALHIAPHVAGAEQPLVERALADGARGVLIAPRWRTLAAEEADAKWLCGLGVPTVLMERRPRPGSALHALDSVCYRPLVRRPSRRRTPGRPRSPQDRLRHPRRQPHRTGPAHRLHRDRRSPSGTRRLDPHPQLARRGPRPHGRRGPAGRRPARCSCANWTPRRACCTATWTR